MYINVYVRICVYIHIRVCKHIYICINIYIYIYIHMRKEHILEGHCGSRRAWARPVIRRWRPHTMPSALLSSILVFISPPFVQPSPRLTIRNLFNIYKCMLNKYNYSLEQCLDELFWGLSRIEISCGTNIRSNWTRCTLVQFWFDLQWRNVCTYICVCVCVCVFVCECVCVNS